MEWSHVATSLLTALVTATTVLVPLWTKRRRDLVAIAKGEFDNESSVFLFLRKEWDKSYQAREKAKEEQIELLKETCAEEREARNKLLERTDKIEINRDELREKLAVALTENLKLKTENLEFQKRLPCVNPSQGPTAS